MSPWACSSTIHTKSPVFFFTKNVTIGVPLTAYIQRWHIILKPTTPNCVGVDLRPDILLSMIEVLLEREREGEGKLVPFGPTKSD